MTSADEKAPGSPGPPAQARPQGKSAKCPSCGRPARWEDNPFRPFCSERCKQIDLAAWADEEYAVPGEPVPPEPEPEGER